MERSVDPIVMELMQETTMWDGVECLCKIQYYCIYLFNMLISFPDMVNCCKQLGFTGSFGSETMLGIMKGMKFVEMVDDMAVLDYMLKNLATD